MATINSGNFQVMVDASKRMTFPTTPGYCIRNNAQVDNVTGDGTLYTPCIFNTELFDRGSNFAANTFTAPTSGTYLLLVNILTSGAGPGMTDGICYIKTTTTTYSTYLNPTNWTSTNYLSYRVAIIAYMNSGDTAGIEFKVSGAGKTVDYYGEATSAHTNFSGVLLC